MASTAESTVGCGRKWSAGTFRTSLMSNRLAHHASSRDAGTGVVTRLANPHSTVNAALRRLGLRPPSKRRSSGVDSEYGGFATTRKSRRGSATVRMSAWMTRTRSLWRKREFSVRTNSGSRSTASTRAWVRASAAVTTPGPAPRSRTRSSGPGVHVRTSVSSTSFETRKWTPEGLGRSARRRLRLFLGMRGLRGNPEEAVGSGHVVVDSARRRNARGRRVAATADS